MSTGLIIVIVVAAVILLALVAAVPRMRQRARVRARERELGERRHTAAAGHREAADQLEQRADVAERKARIAEQEAARERAGAQVRQERAELHERGLADNELISDDERGDFAGVKRGATPDTRGEDPTEGSSEPATRAADHAGEQVGRGAIPAEGASAGERERGRLQR
jgi:hypothetical protein